MMQILAYAGTSMYVFVYNVMKWVVYGTMVSGWLLRWSRCGL